MASEWHEVAVEDIKAPSENALATGPFGSSIGSRFFVDAGVPVIRGSNLSEDIGLRLKDEDLVFLSADKAKEFSRSTVREGDLVFTCWGTVNQIGLIDKHARYQEYVISNKQMKLTPDPEQADSLFLYYLFSSPELQDRIKKTIDREFGAWFQPRPTPNDADSIALTFSAARHCPHSRHAGRQDRA
jgi:type I restriction enzyme, S subunit